MAIKKCPACRHSIDEHSSSGCQIKVCTCKLKPSQIIGSDFGNNTLKKQTPEQKKPDQVPVPEQKKPEAASNDKDGLGFRKKDYPIILIVGLLCLNIWAFNVNTSTMTGILIAGCIDLIGVYWLYRKFKPKKTSEAELVNKKTAASSGQAARSPARISKKPAAAVANDDKDERGIFGIKKKGYPTLFMAIVGIVTIAAVMQRTVPVIIVAAVIDIAIAYWYLKKKKVK